MSAKFYHVCGRAYDNNGKLHVVTVVGKVEQGTRKEEVTLENPKLKYDDESKKVFDAKVSYFEKTFYRELTVGAAICHPEDEFDEEIGINIAKSRIKKGIAIGKLSTNDLSMLTYDAVYAELLVKLNYIVNHIDNYIG